MSEVVGRMGRSEGGAWMGAWVRGGCMGACEEMEMDLADMWCG